MLKENLTSSNESKHYIPLSELHWPSAVVFFSLCQQLINGHVFNNTQVFYDYSLNKWSHISNLESFWCHDSSAKRSNLGNSQMLYVLLSTECSVTVFISCVDRVWASVRVSALAAVDSSTNCCTDSEHESPEDTATVDLTCDWLQTKEKNRNSLSLGIWTCLKTNWWLTVRVQNTVFPSARQRVEHSVPASTIQQAVFSCRALTHMHTHYTLSSNTKLHNTSIHPCDLQLIVELQYACCVDVSVGINVCGWVCVIYESVASSHV